MADLIAVNARRGQIYLESDGPAAAAADTSDASGSSLCAQLVGSRVACKEEVDQCPFLASQRARLSQRNVLA